MRCKNCGSQNDDNLYICQNCGSPLYEEETEQITGSEAGNRAQDRNGTTKMFTPPTVGNGYDNAAHIPASQTLDKTENGDNKKQIIIIIVLAVVLVALITGLVAGVLRNKSDNKPTASVSAVTDKDGATLVTEDTEDHTEKTTETTTETTTTTTTTEAKKQYTITVGTNDSGWAEGGGTFKEGDSVTVYCGADDGYQFDGWYKDGKKVSGDQKYTFKANDDVYMEARFFPMETTTQEAEPDTTAAADGNDTIDGGDIG